MKKSRIFAVLAAMAMGLAVFGCSNGDSDSSGGDTTGGSSSGSGTTGGSTFFISGFLLNQIFLRNNSD